MDYIDLPTLGEDYCNENGGRQTDYGLIIETVGINKQLVKQNEEEEEEYE